ncbi:MAG: preprotein translocase subunit SecG [Planctomycetota bacterium]|jgi:preprotein translocase subunit SecG
MTALLLAFSFMSFFKGVLMFVFVATALLLILVILLQEPKGGGLSAAFGGAGAETFGVQTGGVNRFTAYVAATFMVAAVLYAALRDESTDVAPSDRLRDTITAPEQPGGETDESPGGETESPGEEDK